MQKQDQKRRLITDCLDALAEYQQGMTVDTQEVKNTICQILADVQPLKGNTDLVDVCLYRAKVEAQKKTFAHRLDIVHTGKSVLVMIDYIYVFSKKENIQDWQTLNPRLIPHYKERNKQPYKLTLRMRGLSAEVNQYGELKIKGSLHKYCLGNNTEPLTLETLKKGVLKLCKYLNVEPSRLFFRNIEFGLNIFLPFPVVEILQSTIYCLGRQFNDMDSTLPKLGKTNGNTQISDYTIKLYDKYRQTTEDKKIFSNMLRYEVHGNNIRYCHKLGIKTMQDLTNASFENLTQEMTKLLKQCILVPFGMERVVYLTPTQETNYLRFRDFEYWEDLTKAKRLDNKRVLNRMLETYGGYYINEIIKYISEPQKPLAVFERKQGANLLPNWVTYVYHFEEIKCYDTVSQNSPKNKTLDEVNTYHAQLCGKTNKVGMVIITRV